MTLPRPSSPSASVLCRRSGEQSVGMGSPTCQQMGTGGDQVGVQASLGSQEAPPALFSPSFSSSSVGGESIGVAGGGFVAAQEGCSRRGVHDVPGVFWPSVLRAQGLRGLEASARLGSAESLSPGGPLQDGDCVFHWEAVRPGDWGASLDLTDAYFHVPVVKADRK